MSRNLRGPAGGIMICGESDGFIVAKSGLTSRERRELTVNVQLSRRYAAD
jgi:hypothetical protein